MSRLDDEPGVPLSDYIDKHPDIGVRVYCQSCALTRDYPMSEMVAELERRGKDARSTGIREIGWMMTKPCSRCGAVKWDTSPASYVTSEKPAW